MKTSIVVIHAREVLDSRGNPKVGAVRIAFASHAFLDPR